MSHPLLLANRIAPALVAILAATVGGWKLITLLPTHTETAPLAVAEVALPAIPVHAVTLPERNIFAADGIAWALPNERPAGAKDTVASSSSGKIMGVIKLPGGPKGVMIDKRFVAIGESVGGGRLKDVRNGRYVIEIDGIEQERPLDAGRKGRIETLLGKRNKQ